jgi:lysozyme
MTDILIKAMRFEEGLENEPYYDIYQYPTIGFGKKIGIKNAPLDMFTLYMPDEVAECWLSVDLEALKNIIENDYRTKTAWENCNQARQDMLTAMAYQMGFEGLCGFQKMLSAMEIESWEDAYLEALDSKWARFDTPQRANREATVILEGDYGVYDGLLE